jgi:photosystem II stability/assembly factor-like uncharacterized protein
MTGPGRRFKAADVFILGVVGIGLVLAAVYSETIVARGRNGEELEPPTIRWRDQFYGVAAPSNGVLWMAGSGGKVVRSRDGGLSWEVQSTGVTEHLQDIAAWDGDRAVAVGNDGVVIVTSDGGASWTKVSAPRSQIANKLMRVRVFQPGTAWAVGVLGAILYSDDSGTTWQRRSEEVDLAWNDIAFADPDNGWAVGEFGSMMHSPDRGATWEQVDPVSERSLMGISFRDSQHGVAVGLDGLVLRTDDAGATWREVDGGTPLHLFDVAWDGSEWVAVGGMGVVVTGSADGETWRARRLSERDLAWHTEVAPTDDGVFIAGASQGRWRDGEWTPTERG